VRKGGLEPPQVLPHRLLRPARLPVPPLSRGGKDSGASRVGQLGGTSAPFSHPRRQVLSKWKKDWKAFERAPAGERFIRRYKARKQKGRGWARIASVVVGIVLVVGGAILLVIPGPGLLVIAFGGALVGQEFRWAAVALDWTEVQLRKLVRLGARFWNSASVALRAGVVAVGVAAGAGAAYLAWNWFFG
jgi:hypothetical protein